MVPASMLPRYINFYKLVPAVSSVTQRAKQPGRAIDSATGGQHEQVRAQMVPEATRPTTEVKRLLTILPDQDASWGSALRPSLARAIGSRQEERKGSGETGVAVLESGFRFAQAQVRIDFGNKTVCSILQMSPDERINVERTKEYDELIEAVAMKYEERAMALLKRIGAMLALHSMAVDEPWQMFGDDYRWSMMVWREVGDVRDPESGVDITIEIAESQAYGDDPEYGINFGLDIVEYGGRILGGLSPYNYTDQCWVDARDEDAVEERWLLLEQAHIGEIPSLVMS